MGIKIVGFRGIVPLVACLLAMLVAGVAVAENPSILDQWMNDSPEQQFLSVDEAFQVSVTRLDDERVAVHWQVTPEHYVYKNKILLRDGNGADLSHAAMLPEGIQKDDEFFGRVEIFDHDFEVIANLPVGAIATLEVEYQGCADAGLCYPPQTRRFPLDGTASASNNNVSPKPAAPDWFAAIGLAFAAGLALTFTPCVLPMIPILSSIIVQAQGEHPSKFKSALLSFSYVLGTVTTYSIAGAIAGATGEQLQAYFQNTWAIGGFAALFFILALGMLGAYELRVPASFQSRLSNSTGRFNSGSLAGSYGVGLISALIIGACVGPLVIGVLSFALENRDPLLGAVMMGSMALGMGAFLVLFGLGAGFLLPKAGPWMTLVNQVFGFLLLAVAVYVLGTLPEIPILLLWGILLVFAGVFFGALTPLPTPSTAPEKIAKTFTVLLMIWGVFALIGSHYGERDVLRPLPSFSDNLDWSREDRGSGTMEMFTVVRTLDELDQALNDARRDGRPALLDFYATWCNDCVKMEETTFRRSSVQRALTPFHLIKADVTVNNDDSRRLKQKFGVYGPPATLFFDSTGNEIKSLRSYGYLDEAEFLARLTDIPTTSENQGP